MTRARLLWMLRMSAAWVGRECGVALLLLGTCVFGYFMFVAPMRAQALAVRTELSAAAHRVSPPAVRLAARDALDQFYAGLPSVDDQFVLMARLHKAAAAQNLVLERGDYQFLEEAGAPLVRYEIDLPVKGDYAQIRRFVSAAMQDVPTLALKSISFGRQKSDEAQLTAKLVLVLYLKKGRA